MLSHITFLAALADLQVTMSVLNKYDTSSNVVIRVLYVFMINVSHNFDVVIAVTLSIQKLSIS